MREFDYAVRRIYEELYNRLVKGDIENPSVSEKSGIWDDIDY